MVEGASRGSLVALAAIATLIGGARLVAQQTPRFVERVDVARIIVDARVLDDRGSPVPGLTADDFKVTIDGAIARVETATWVGGDNIDLDTALPGNTTPLREAAVRPLRDGSSSFSFRRISRRRGCAA